MTLSLEKIKQVILSAMLGLSLVWVFFALSVQLYFVYLELTNKDERTTQIANEIAWKIDGTFKDNPDNIWYEGPKK